MGEYMKPYTPTLYYDRYALMLIEVRRCPICGKWMLPDTRNPFPTAPDASKETQLKNAGWVKEGRCNINGGYPCVECEQSATFVCALCGKEQPGSEIEESFGDPPEYLCKTCYGNVSAKDWAEKKAELRESHRWDFD